MKKTDIKEVVVKVFRESEGRLGSVHLRIVSWDVNGKITPPRLELREIYKNEKYGKRLGKSKGFSLDDLRFMADHWDEIIDAFGAKTE